MNVRAKSLPQQADLFPQDAKPLRKVVPPQTAVRQPRLWLCVAFPDLALRAAVPDIASCQQPVAVVSKIGSRSVIQACNTAAKESGVAVNQPLNAALALAPRLLTYERDTYAEQQLFEQWLQRCRCVTPVVTEAPGQKVLLEIQGSLGLFGSVQMLLAALRRALPDVRLQLASSPVAQAALWLVQAGCEWHLTELADRRLRELPVTCLQWPERVQQQFVRLGVNTLGDCLRLPRDGFAKRFGIERLQELDRGFGRAPEVHQTVRETEAFDSVLELGLETVNYQHIAVLLEQQLDELGVFLRRQQLAVQQLTVCLLQREFMVGEGVRNSHTEVTLDLLEGCPNTDGLAELIALRFERVELRAPVHAVQLRTQTCLPLAATHHAAQEGAMFAGDAGGAAEASGDGVQLIERLRQRLGYRQVYSLAVNADYRPERAWHKAEPLAVAEQSAAYTVARRPLWLLPEPRELNSPDALSGHPERIQSGWWDGADAQRDYFSWRHRSGQRYWLYRDKGGWHLHGLFG